MAAVLQTPSAATAPRDGAYDWPRRLAFSFMAVAVLVRIVFWVYTDRIWEDALITLAPARNVWEGNGLTHHVGEPRIHSFTSPVSVLVPLIGEAFGKGIATLRLVSLVAAAATIWLAHLVSERLKISLAGRVFLFGYLATDQLHIFFGMSGMETQIAVAVVLAGLLALLDQRWTLLGLCCGLALITRPEFALWAGLVGVTVLVTARRDVLRFAAASATVAAPWFLFATIYYGSPIPHTIEAKSFYSGGLTRAPAWESLAAYLSDWWIVLAPFRSYFFTATTPLPEFWLQLIALTVLLLAVRGFFRLRRNYIAVYPVVGFLVVFFLYRTWGLLSTYFMWYLPPLTALVAVLAAAGLDDVRAVASRTATALTAALTLAFAMHIPYSFPLEKRIQEDVELGVRMRVGNALDARMTPDDAAVMEPLGYIGFAAFNKTMWDFPGLSSEVVTDALAELPPDRRNLASVVDKLRPRFAVLRDHELEFLRGAYPDTAAAYHVVEVVEARPGLDLSQRGLTYSNGDTKFSLLERKPTR
jgi:hypothetical protein